VPGDKVRALILGKKRGLYKSLLEEIIAPSPMRILPKCVHFQTCGGCRWQHTEYQKQLRRKESFVRHCLAPHLTHETKFEPILPCDPPWNYRNKMEYSFSNNAAKDKFLGFVIDSSHKKVFNLTECHLTNDWFAEGVKAVRNWWKETDLVAYHPYTNTGSLRTLTFREGQRTGDRMAFLTVSGNPEFALKKQHLESFISHLRDAIEPIDPKSYLSIFVRIQQAVAGQATNFYEMHLYGPDHIREILYIAQEEQTKPLSLAFKISPAAFFQPNTRQAEQLYSLALRYLNIPVDSIVYDLYCGTGTLGICAAKFASKVIGIELSPEASLDAKLNANSNGFNNVEILCGPVAKILKEIETEKSYPEPQIVMVDPPRAGLEPDAIKHILQLKPKKILYISCNPASQAENLEQILPFGYRVSYVQPVDQFPHTVHVENIVILERVSKGF
jgi:23S rRNA (uracil1939-C5)-methyltransferase